MEQHLEGASGVNETVMGAMPVESSVTCPYCKTSCMISGGDKSETKIAKCENPLCQKNFAVTVEMVTHAHIKTYRIGRKS